MAELTAAQRRLALETHYAHLRALPAGTPLQVAVRNAPSFAYGDTVTIVRPLRPPSTNISVHDQHGKLWRFPMLCLISEAEDESIRTALRGEIGAQVQEAWAGLLDRSLAAQGKADNS